MEFGPLNQERLIPYRRFDFRTSRTVRLDRGELLLYLDVFNAMNRENAQGAAYGPGVLPDGRLVTHRTIHPQLGILPSLGVRWVF